MKKPLGLVLLSVATCAAVAYCIYFLLFRSSSPHSLSPASIAQPFSLLEPTPTPQPETIELVFVGDIMLDRNIRLKAQQQGYDALIGKGLKELLLAADHTVANLEGPITANDSTSVGSAPGSTRNFIFTFPPETTKFLKDNNITIVNLGNNHILNFGVEGLADTYKFLDQDDLAYFGFTGTTQPANSTTYILDHGDTKIGFVNYNQFISGGETQAFEDIEKLRPQVDYLIMYTHWGNEYVPENQVLVDLAHRFVDGGVDLVIGSHPHVITGHEIYKDKHIYYSLGNFIFDQYFDEEVKKGLVIRAIINPTTKETIPVEYNVSIDPSTGTELKLIP